MAGHGQLQLSFLCGNLALAARKGVREKADPKTDSWLVTYGTLGTGRIWRNAAALGEHPVKTL